MDKQRLRDDLARIFFDWPATPHGEQSAGRETEDSAPGIGTLDSGRRLTLDRRGHCCPRRLIGYDCSDEDCEPPAWVSDRSDLWLDTSGNPVAFATYWDELLSDQICELVVYADFHGLDFSLKAGRNEVAIHL